MLRLAILLCVVLLCVYAQVHARRRHTRGTAWLLLSAWPSLEGLSDYAYADDVPAALKETLDEDKASIFVSIPSFRDQLCHKTVEHAINQATRPERVVLGIYEQNDDANEACVNSVMDDKTEIRVITVPANKARGPAAARHHCYTLYKDEDIYMQIDSHSEFLEGWDVKSVRMLNQHPSALDKFVLATHPINTAIEDWRTTKNVPVINNVKLDGNNDFTFTSTLFEQSEGEFMRARTIGAGLLVAHRSAIKKVPLDPGLDGLFLNEELLHTARMYTNGIDVYAPNVNVVAHVYQYPEHKVPWAETSFSWTEGTKGKERSNQLLGGELPGDEYGMGTVRRLDDFFRSIGVEFKERKIGEWKPGANARALPARALPARAPTRAKEGFEGREPETKAPRDEIAYHEIHLVQNPYSKSTLHWCTPTDFCKRNWPNTFDFDYDIKQHIVSSAMTLPRNFAIIDCGAHIGDGAIPIADALKVGGRADITVYAIEPSPEKCRFMRTMAEMNKLENLKVLQYGLSDRDGDKYAGFLDKYYFAISNTGGTKWHTDSREENSIAIGEEAIEFTQLDTLIKDGLVNHRIGYIHLDVETMEPQAIRGALRMFVRDRPILSAETVTEQHRADILEILQPHGYRFDRTLNENSLFIPTKAVPAVAPALSGKEGFEGRKPQTKAPYKTVVSLTTLPERLIHPSFLDKCSLLKEACSHDDNCTIQINIPFYTMKNVPYVIPTSIQALQANKFHIYRDIQDVGPITKLMGALKNPGIDEKSYIIIVDDDIPYKKDFVKLLQTSFDENPGRHIHCMCNASIAGYKGFGFQKKLLMQMVDMTMPKKCMRVDDDYIQLVSEKLKIGIVSVPYYGDTSLWCSTNKHIHDHEEKTIQWSRLKYDDRTKITPECKNAFYVNTISFYEGFKNINDNSYKDNYTYQPIPIYNEKFPNIVHLIYFPWEISTGILKSNENDFDHTFFNKMKFENPNYQINLWTLSKIKHFTNQFYPEINFIWNKIKHPVQLVDVFRLLVVYHYGGIYWQYESEQKVKLECFTPPSPKTIRLFVETIIDDTFSENMKNEPIRKGKPEELIRVATQCFSAFPKDKFLEYIIHKSIKNLNTLSVKTQYDILYVSGNAMISEAYNEYNDKEHIFLTYDTSKYIHFSSKGSWRLKSY